MTWSRGGSNTGGQSREPAKEHSKTGGRTERWLAQPANEAQAGLRKVLDQAGEREADEVALRRVWSRLADLPGLLPLSAADRVRERAETASDNDRSRRTRWPWIVVASLAGVTATLAFMLVRSNSQVAGSGKPRAQAAQVATAGTPAKREGGDERSAFVAPATVRTGRGETLQLALRGGTDVVVQSESVLVLDENDRLAVTTGEVQFHVPPQAPGRTFTVDVGAYRVVVVGTRFRVRKDSPSVNVGVGVDVDEGVVEIWTDHRIARVTAGQSWLSPKTPAAAVVTPPAVGTEPAASTSTSTKTARDAVRSVASAPARDAPAAKRPLLAMASPGASGNVTTRGISAIGGSPSSATVPVATGLSTTTNGGDGLLPLVADSSVPGALAVSPSVNDLPPLAFQARAARLAGDSRRALGLYLSLASKGGTAGENAEYEIGRILRDGLHQPREAVSAWRAYRAQHPRGLLRVESDLSIIETLVSVGDKAGAVVEASDFIRRYPDSERRTEVARLTGDLLRERGDCAAAVDAYDVALVGGRGRRELGRDAADVVSFQRSTCLLRGDAIEGTQALKAYLQAFPGGRFRAEAQRLINSGAASPASRL